MAVFDTSKVVPNTSWPVPSVTMNDGILSTVTRNELIEPTATAAANGRRSASQSGHAQTIHETPMRIEASPYM